MINVLKSFKENGGRVNLKILFKKSLSLVLACLMLLAVIPMTASAAKYENPEFKVSLLSETSSEVVVTLDLTSG